MSLRTCSVHIAHEPFKTVHNKVDWNIIEFIRKCYYLFKDFPPEEADYKRLTKSEKFPLKFCGCFKICHWNFRSAQNIIFKWCWKNSRYQKLRNCERFIGRWICRSKLYFILTIAEECQSFFTENLNKWSCVLLPVYWMRKNNSNNWREV